MEDQNNTKLVQEDPIVMYLIVHTTLNMSVGKLSAQVGHAASLVVFDYSDLKDESRKVQQRILAEQKAMSAGDSNGSSLPSLQEKYADMSRKLSIIGEWRGAGYRKVTLAADDKEWEKVKRDYPNDVLVVDAGLTEIPSGSETVIGLWPMRKSQATKTISRLQVLK
ncbi:MAG TPA: aminoacyl-tRNA hydrolase [Candidatus Saccharimonadales bacterium]